DQLFATLDTLTRRVHLAHGMDCVLSDTVGFVRDLPHGLVDAFHATLEETAQADLLLHVLDGSSQERELQAQEVFKVLHEIGAGDIPRIDILNKCDLLNLSPSVAGEKETVHEDLQAAGPVFRRLPLVKVASALSRLCCLHFGSAAESTSCRRAMLL
ncbi:MAG: hypothetical protein EBW19_12130, partial [Betaproteobacteria bacterium]|nr:hypothetical protein [Betaproteobacteria bacterium]